MYYRAIYNDHSLSCRLTDRATAREFARVVSTKSRYVVALVAVAEKGPEPMMAVTLWADSITHNTINHAQPALL